MRTMRRVNRKLKAQERCRPIVPWYSDARACAFCGSEDHEAHNCRAAAKAIAAEARGRALRLAVESQVVQPMRPLDAIACVN